MFLRYATRQSRRLVHHSKHLPHRSFATAEPGRIRKLWQNGNLLMGFGWAALGLLTIDRALQFLDNQDSDQIIDMLEEETQQKRQELQSKYWDAPALYKSKVTLEYKMGGSHGLKDVKLGDIVEVLQEKVGPGEYYHLCRTLDEKGEVQSIGWYPCSYLEKSPEKKKKGWLRP